MNKDHYIYFLYDKNNIVRYVGLGRNRRYKDYTNRSAEYKSIIDNGGKALVIIDNLSKTEAIELENKYLAMFKGKVLEGFNLINKQGRNGMRKTLSYQECSEEFYLDMENFPYVRYKNTKRSGNKGSVVSTKAGELVRQKVARDYPRVNLKGKSILIHRLIWVLANKMDLDCHFVVDHIDGDPSNNHPSNLQAITQQQNIRKANIASTTGFTGVHIPKGNPNSYVAVWTVNGKQYAKYFSIKTYGKEVAFEMACEHRLKMQQQFYK